MKRKWNVLLVTLLAMPAFAQDPAPADQPPADQPADQAAPADSSSGQAAPTEQAPAEGEAAPAAESSGGESAPSEVPAGTSKPWRLYAGGDYVASTLSSSNLGGFGTNNFDSGIYRVRAGMRVLDAFGLEAHLGVKRGGDAVGEAETKSYYGLFAVPTATVLETIELAFPVGYAMTKVDGAGGASADLKSLAYGIDAELPLRLFAASLPDIRFTAGGMVYYQKTDARLYGYNAGLRYDFSF